MQDLKANPNLPAHGTIIEAQLDKGSRSRSNGADSKRYFEDWRLYYRRYYLRPCPGLMTDRGEKVREALPSTPVEVLGLNDVPMAGDMLDATDERTARTVAEKRVAKICNEEVHKVGKVSWMIFSNAFRKAN